MIQLLGIDHFAIFGKDRVSTVQPTIYVMGKGRQKDKKEIKGSWQSLRDAPMTGSLQVKAFLSRRPHRVFSINQNTWSQG